jgi:hypothetical protein
MGVGTLCVALWTQRVCPVDKRAYLMRFRRSFLMRAAVRSVDYRGDGLVRVVQTWSVGAYRSVP